MNFIASKFSRYCRGLFAVRGAWRLGAVLLFANLLAPAQNALVETNHPFRLGFSLALMPDVNESDARAAMKVWAETIVVNGVLRADPNVMVFHDFDSMFEALQNHTVDGVATTVTDFSVLQTKVQFNRFVFDVAGGSIFDEYVLLVNQSSGLAKVKDLRGRKLNLLNQSRTCLALPWLDTLLLEQHLKPAREFCGQITEETKLTQTILPVFFGKADACLVTRKGFKTMSELNPQVGQRLRALATSPPLVPAGIFFCASYPHDLQERFLAEFTNVHKNPTGGQILNVFQTERLEENPASVMDSALALLKHHRELLASTNTFPSIAIASAQTATNGVTP